MGTSLYRSLATVYDELFPLPALAPAFLEKLVLQTSPRRRRALDAGCATGSLVLALAERGWEAVGIEPEAAMVEIARDTARRRGLDLARFERGDMLDARELAGPGPFDLALCLGNTLPHLSREDARRFFSVALALLGPGGSLVLQLMNYAKAEVGPGFVFPPIEASGLRFSRRYEAGPEGRLRFIAALDEAGSSGQEGAALGGEVLLSPHAPEWIAEALGEAGFTSPSFASGWEGGSFDPHRDRYLIVVARS